MRGLFALSMLVAVAAVVAADANACSCARLDLRRELARADAAFVGRLISKRLVSPPLTRSDELAVYTFAVDAVVKGRLGRRVAVISAAAGDSCGLEVRRGQRIGLLLYRQRKTWRSHLCSQTSPRALRAAGRSRVLTAVVSAPYCTA